MGSPLRETAVEHPHECHDAPVLIELRIKDQRPWRGVKIALWGRNPLNDRLEHVDDTLSGLRRDAQRLGWIAAEQVRDLSRDAVRVGSGQVHLVEDGNQLEAGVDRGVGVGDGLRLDALGRVDDQQSALAGRQAA